MLEALTASAVLFLLTMITLTILTLRKAK